MRVASRPSTGYPTVSSHIWLVVDVDDDRAQGDLDGAAEDVVVPLAGRGGADITCSACG
jgi:hypothetical protein